MLTLIFKNTGYVYIRGVGKINRLLSAHTLLCALAMFPGRVEAWVPKVYPAAPKRMSSAEFSVNNFDRNDVVAFWHAVYQASEGYDTRVGWTGNFNGSSGKTSAEFVDDVERRLNYFRAMCGVHSHAKVNSGSKVVIQDGDPFKPLDSVQKEVAVQEAALLLVRNYNSTTGVDPALTHSPPPGLAGWSPAAWNACSKGNFAFGIYGPGAITEYMIERLSKSTATSSWNSLVGHRRWCLYPDSTDFATGDQPGSGPTKPPSNVFYVLQNPEEYLEDLQSDFVAFPAAGYFPAPVNSPFWSLSKDGADFSEASVKMTDASGNVVPIIATRRGNDYGDPAIIWEVSGAAAAASVYSDVTFKVRVTGIKSVDPEEEVIPPTHEYSVTLINPDRITSPQTLAGSASVPSTQSAIYTFRPPTGAEALQVVSYKKSTAKWKETAEGSAKPLVIDGTGSNYPLVAKASTYPQFGIVSGKNYFHLTFPVSYDPIVRGVPSQFFELNREILPAAKAKLKFAYRRGFMTRSSTLVVETSTDGGNAWKVAGSPIKGISDTQFDQGVSQASITLPKSTTPIRVRFRYFTNGGSIYTHEAAPTYPTGIFIDDISTEKCSTLEEVKINYLAGTASKFVFNSNTAGAKLKKGESWQLAMRTKLGGKWFPPGPPKALVIAK